MGLLDDAIREHLDLKRRRGGDPAEIERAEREALGPVRRNFDEPDASAATPDAPAAEPAMLQDPAEDWHEDLPEAPVGAGYEPLGEHEDLPPSAWEDEEEHFAPADATRELRSAPPEPPLPGLDVETSEYDVEAEHEAGDGDEDVLEETPDFLQDTPDHDRLWFEQRPPRDFDFDG